MELYHWSITSNFCCDKTEPRKLQTLPTGLTLCDPMDCGHQAPLSMGFSRQEYWSELPFPSSRDLYDPGIEPGSPAWQADSFAIWATREAHWTPAGRAGHPPCQGLEIVKQIWSLICNFYGDYRCIFMCILYVCLWVGVISLQRIELLKIWYETDEINGK